MGSFVAVSSQLAICELSQGLKAMTLTSTGHVSVIGQPAMTTSKLFCEGGGVCVGRSWKPDTRRVPMAVSTGCASLQGSSRAVGGTSVGFVTFKMLNSGGGVPSASAGAWACARASSLRLLNCSRLRARCRCSASDRKECEAAVEGRLSVAPCTSACPTCGADSASASARASILQAGMVSTAQSIRHLWPGPAGRSSMLHLKGR
mmetsp:Transcript_10094/g.25879  ORF Transcript_10094/g.25879 Transcript_10094/m.25879 type:complete len:204 (-) Transcript_10094:60-671(-)